MTSTRSRDAQLCHALRTVVEWLPRLQEYPDDAQPRLNLMLAALMSGHGSDHTGGGLAQALSHAIGRRSPAPNGVVEALLLPHAMRFNAGVVGHRAAALAAGIPDSTGVSSAAVIDGIEKLSADFGVPKRLRDIGVTEDALGEATEHAMDDWAITASPRVPDRDDVLELLTSAW